MDVNKNLKIIFVIRSPDQFHYFSSIIEALCVRGHLVSLLFDVRYAKRGKIDQVEGIKKKFYNFSYEFVPSRTDCWWRPLFALREIWSYSRFLVIPNQSDTWRKLQLTYISPRIRPLVRARNSFLNWLLGRSIFLRIFRLIETITPPDKKITARLLSERPDVVVASPGNYRFSTADIEYLKAAKSLGIPTAVPVISWDNLTVRGPLFIIPDRLLAWNQAHAKEAVEWHGVPKENIRIIGSSFFDGWFTPLEISRPKAAAAVSKEGGSLTGFTSFSPSCSRKDFSRKTGLSENKPYLLWLGSSKNIAPDETWLVQEVKRALENSPDKKMREMQILVRPHPRYVKQYEALGRQGIAVFPRQAGHQMFTEDERQLFYDTIYYSVAAVNINTSGIIDAILAGKPAIAILDEKYRQSQEETKHFRYLADYKAIAFVRSPEKCAEEIKKIMEGNDEHAEERAAFIKDFIRPRGLEISAGEAAAEEIEELTAATNKK